MDRDDVQGRAREFVGALMRKDPAALAAMFVTEQPVYADGCRPGLSTGLPAVAEHLSLLCEALKDTTVSHVDTLTAPDSACLLYTSPSPRDGLLSRMPSSA